MGKKLSKKKKGSVNKSRTRNEKVEESAITPEEATSQLFQAIKADDKKSFEKALKKGANFYGDNGVSIVESVVDSLFIIPNSLLVLGYSGKVDQLQDKKSSDYKGFMEQRGAYGESAYRKGIKLEDNCNDYLKQVISQRPEEYEKFAKTEGFQKVLDKAISQSSGQVMNTLISINKEGKEQSLEILPPSQQLVSKTLERASKEVRETKEFKDSMDSDMFMLQMQGSLKNNKEASNLSDNFYNSTVGREKLRKSFPFFKVAETLVKNAGQEVLWEETEKGIASLRKEIIPEMVYKLGDHMTSLERAAKYRKKELKDIESRPSPKEADENMLRLLDDEKEDKLTKRYKALSKSLKEDDIEYIRESKVIERATSSEKFTAPTKRGAYLNLLERVADETEKSRDTNKTLKALEAATNNEEIYVDTNDEREAPTKKEFTPKKATKKTKYNKNAVINNNNNFLDWFADRDEGIKKDVEELLKSEEVYISKDQNIDSYVSQIKALSKDGRDVTAIVQAINTAYEAADEERKKRESAKSGEKSKKKEQRKADEFLEDEKPKLNKMSASDRAFKKAFEDKLAINSQMNDMSEKLEVLMSRENIADKGPYIQKLRKSFNNSSGSFKKLESTYGRYYEKSSSLLERRSTGLEGMQRTREEYKDEYAKLREQELENPSEQKGVVLSKRQKELNEQKSRIDKLDKQIAAEKKKLKGTKFHTEKWSSENLDATRQAMEQVFDDLQLVEEIANAQRIDEVEKSHQSGVKDQIKEIRQQKQKADDTANKFRQMIADSKRGQASSRESLEKIQKLSDANPGIAPRNFELMERLEKSGGKFEQSKLTNTEKILLGDFMGDYQYNKPPQIIKDILRSFPKVSENMESNMRQFYSNLPNIDAINQGIQIGFFAGIAPQTSYTSQQQRAIETQKTQKDITKGLELGSSAQHISYFHPKSKKAGKEGENPFDQTVSLEEKLGGVQESLSAVKKDVWKKNQEELKEGLQPLRGELKAVDDDIGNLQFDMDEKTQKKWSKAIIDFNSLSRLHNARNDKMESKSSTLAVEKEKNEEKKQLEAKEKKAHFEQIQYFKADKESQESQEQIRSLGRKFPGLTSNNIQQLQMLEASGGRFDCGAFTGLGVVVLGEFLSQDRDEKSAAEFQSILEGFPMVEQNLQGSIRYYKDKAAVINNTPMFPVQEQLRQVG